MISHAGVHPLDWARVFLPHHMPAPSPAFHYNICDMVFSGREQVALAAPRGHGKSTVVNLICLLFAAASQQFKYIIILSDTHAQAEMFLAEVKREAESNEYLRAAYPGLFPGKPWAANDICFLNGVRIQALGAGEKLRGRKQKGTRPDLILVDDLENDELVANYDRRMKLRRWFRASLLPIRAPGGKIRVVGTILHSDSLLNRLLRNASWERRLWRALSDNSEALWPEWRPAEKLLAEKEEAKKDGLLSIWYQEFQNQAIADEESSFRSDDFTYFETIPLDQYGKLAVSFKSLYVDPAISKSEKADFSAYTVVYSDHTGVWYVQEAFRARHNPSEIIETIRKLHKKHAFDVIGIESVQYQKSLSFWLEELTKDSDESYPVEEVIPDQDKRRRILALQPYFRRQKIVIRRGMDRLENELLNIDSIDHDDLADSLAGHLFITNRPGKPRKPKPAFTDDASRRAYRHKRMLKKGRGKFHTEDF
jgi:predicted phage terminase large subunit-like protein